MKVTTSELSGVALDWAVAGLEGEDVWRESRNIYVRDDSDFVSHYSPSTDWAQGGPIIEREGVMIERWVSTGHWQAANALVTKVFTAETPLIAAMRCYAASKLGDEVEVSEELINGQS